MPFLGELDSENLAEKFERASAVALEIGQNFAHIEMPFGAEPAGIEQEVAGNGHAHDRASNVDVREIEGFAVKGHETLRPDLADIGPEVRQQFALIRLAIGPRALEFEPVNADADDSPGTGVQAEAFEDFLPVFVGFDIQKNFPGSCRNPLRILSDGLDIDDECRWLSHAHSLRAGRTGQDSLDRRPSRLQANKPA